MAAVWFQIVLGPVETVAEVDSTNRVLMARARAGAPAGLVLVAEHQTAGRGRLGRSWEAAPGAALLVSVLLRPTLPADRLHLLTFAAGLAAVATCAELGATATSLKWPNDVVVDDATGTRKLAGLLAESVVEADGVRAVVVGMGLNLRRGGLPDGAVAMDDLVAEHVVARPFLDRWLVHLAHRLEPVDEGALLDEYRRCSSTIGRRVRVDLAGGSIEGVAVDVDDEASLVVDHDGILRTVRAGDVVHLRAV